MFVRTLGDSSIRAVLKMNSEISVAIMHEHLSIQHEEQQAHHFSEE